MIGRHRLGILSQRDHLLLFGAVEQKQVGELVCLHAIARIDTVLKATTKVLKELLVRLAIVIAHILQIGRDLLLHALGNGSQLAILLQSLAADVEGNVGRVDHATHEVEVVGQQIGALLHDQHVGAVKREAFLVILAI